MRTPRWVAIALAGSALLPAAAAQDSAEAIIEASLKAAGGYEALTSIRSVRRHGQITVTLLGQNLGGNTELVILPWRKARQVSDFGVERQIQGWNGREAWEDGRRGLRKLNPQEAGGIRLQAMLHPLLGYQMLSFLGVPIERQADEAIENKPHHVLAFSLGENVTVRLYVDAATALISRTVISIVSPQLGATIHLEQDTLDYADFEGVKLPRRTRLAVGQLFKFETFYTRTTINEPADESIFEMPGSAGSGPP